MRILVLLLVGLFLSNCSNSYVKSKKNITSPNDLMKFTNIWCEKQKQSDTKIKMCGQGWSKDLNISESKAIIDAKLKIADYDAKHGAGAYSKKLQEKLNKIYSPKKAKQMTTGKVKPTGKVVGRENLPPATQKLLERMDIIPTSIALAQAAKESGWGTSRFALEGNAIFGQWTWSGQGIAPLDRESNKNHKILKFPILRASVKAYQNNLNTHKSYQKFRQKRLSLRDKKRKISGLELTETLNNYAQTGSEYTKILNQIIRQNRLTDFEPVRLVNSVKKIELSS